MFARVARFEFDFQRRNPVFWVAGALFFLLAFGAVASENVQLGSGGNVHANSPYAVAVAHQLLLLFFTFAATAFVANVVVRDDETRFGPIVRSTRVSKFDYLFGRFTGAFAAAALAYLSVPLGLWVGSLMPWVDPETLGSNNPAAYAFAYAVLALPGIFLMSAIFFSLATATRSMMATYLGVVAFLILYIISISALRGRTDLEQARALIEPFGIGAFNLATRYWTSDERNTLLVPFEGALLWNRLLWLGIACLFLALAYFSYRFAEPGLSRRGKRRLEAPAAETVKPATRTGGARLAAPRHDGKARLAQFWSRTRLEMRQVFRSPAYLVLLLMGLGMSVSALWSEGGTYGTQTLPVTRATIGLLGIFTIFPLIIAVYYGGELVWRERERKVHEIIDATPLPNWGFLVPKAIALALVLVSTLAVSVLAAILVQFAKGYTEVELDKYLLWYLLPTAIGVSFIAVLAIFVQALSPSKYFGWAVMVAYIVVQSVAEAWSFEHNLYLFGQAPAVPKSDMNGLGGFWKAQVWFNLYWGAIALLMLVATHLLWRRGTETRLRPRLRLASRRLRGSAGVIASVALVVALVTGGWIFHNTNIINEYRTSQDEEAYLAEYERRFLRYEALPQPTVSAVVLDVAVHPGEQRVETRGRYLLKNLTSRPVREVHIRERTREGKVVALDFPGAVLASNDTRFGYRIYRLANAMAPGDSRTMTFRTRRDQQGFRNSGNETAIVDNGTFLNNWQFVPVIGMSRAGLLSDRAKRREHKLSSELRPARLEDLAATSKPAFGSGWTTADITVSTVADQTPIAPGKKVSDVTQGERRTARFVSDMPILDFFSIQSARYAEKHRRHRGVDLAVYYHPRHHWNVDRMLTAMQTSLDYYQANFGPYQFDQARIIEFPAYAVFAQAFANTMPYSEAFGFTADTRDPDKIDYITYVTAHEFAHQYWAHQVIGADMQGSALLSETLAQYSALMVMKQLYGEDELRRFLKFELNAYLGSRGDDALEELPLVRMENQQYLHYRKGSVVMYLLQDRLGEAAVNRALAAFLTRYRMKGAPYPRSVDLVAALRREAKTSSDQALITDLFERISLWDWKLVEASAARRADGRWDVAVTVQADKYYADGAGKETRTAVTEPVSIGLFTAAPSTDRFDRGNVVSMQRYPMRTGRQTLRFVTKIKPTHAGVDPYNLFVDRNSGDNVKALN